MDHIDGQMQEPTRGYEEKGTTVVSQTDFFLNWES